MFVIVGHLLDDKRQRQLIMVYDYIFRRTFANLPVVVVLPAPCRPTIIMTVGGFVLNLMGLCSPPLILLVHPVQF